VNGLDGAAIARLFRTSCTVCGSGLLAWGSVGDEVGRLVEAGQDADGWLSEVGQGLGMVNSVALLALDAWRCNDCGEVGVFGPLEVGP
jgi:hypothetical protein